VDRVVASSQPLSLDTCAWMARSMF
jgi:hypothetical protein